MNNSRLDFRLGVVSPMTTSKNMASIDPLFVKVFGRYVLSINSVPQSGESSGSRLHPLALLTIDQANKARQSKDRKCITVRHLFFCGLSMQGTLQANLRCIFYSAAPSLTDINQKSWRIKERVFPSSPSTRLDIDPHLFKGTVSRIMCLLFFPNS